MHLAAWLLLGAFVAAIAWMVRWLGRVDTDPAGFVQIGTYRSMLEAEGARDLVTQAGIAARLDDHLDNLHTYGQIGVVRLLVPADRAAEATRLLRVRRAPERDEPAGA